MTPSSQGDSASSRGHLDSLAYCSPEAALTANREAQPHRHTGVPDVSRAGFDSRYYSLDLQKSLEVMRFVIMRENQKLKDLVQQAHDQLAEAERRLDDQEWQEHNPAAWEASLPCGVETAAGPPGCCIEWRIEDLGALAADSGSPAGRDTPDTTESDDDDAPGLCRDCGGWPQRRLALPGHPGVDLELQFRLRGSDDEAGRALDEAAGRPQDRCCEFALSVTGPTCMGLDLLVELSIELEFAELPEGGAGGAGLPSTAALVSTSSARLCGGGTVVCREAPDPAKAAPGLPAPPALATTATCRAEVTCPAGEPGPLHLRSTWGS